MPRLRVTDQKGSPLLNSQDLSGSGRAISSTNEVFSFDFKTEGIRSCNSRFTATLYPDFCVSQDGLIEIPQDTKFEPYQPLISNNYRPDPIDYRRNATCTWVLEETQPQLPIRYTFYFQEFDLRAGAKIEVFYRNRSGSMKTVTVFDQDRPPSMVYSLRFEKVIFTTSDGPPGLGFKADIITDTCPIRALVSAPSGRIHDGTLPGKSYANNLQCSWLIRFDQPSPINFIWEYFVLRENDLLAFYQGNSAQDSALLFLLSGADNTTMSLPPIIKELFIVFKTGEGPALNTTQRGFSFSYKACTGACQRCPPGSFFDYEVNSCVQCPLFTISETGNTSCWPCPNGTFWVSAIKCELCAPGSSSTGHHCVKCNEGLVAPAPGSPQCSQCPRGFITADNINCVPCPEGHTTNAEGLCVDSPDRANYAVVGYTICALVGLMILGALVMLFYKRRPAQQDFDDWGDINGQPWRL